MKSILLVYTGGTIGMVADPHTGSLIPFEFDRLLELVPELSRFEIDIQAQSVSRPIDSSDMAPSDWVELAKWVADHYDRFDGFVILHGTDTMSYTAAALSILLQNLGKPVILTGSQIPMGVIRTDGKENLITAIEIAASYEGSTPIVPEVAIYFEYKLYRGNRTHKYNSQHFDAFHSPNYPLLAEAGIDIQFNRNSILAPPTSPLIVHQRLNTQVGILKLFPGISDQFVDAVLSSENLKGLVLETFGSGNAPSRPEFNRRLKAAIDNGLIVVNVTQCAAGKVEMNRYTTGQGLLAAGVIGGGDITTEAAVVKLMHLLAQDHDSATLAQRMIEPLAGELTLMD